MRKLKLQVQVSIDGNIAGPAGQMDWMAWNWDDQLKDYVSKLHEPVDGILLGRVLAEGFIPHWTATAADPKTADAFSHKMVDTHKVVFTKTLSSSKWDNTSLAQGDIVDEVNKIKGQPGGDLIVYGGEKFVSNLIKNNLIDEYFLFVNPTAIGNGMTIFKSIGDYLPLKLAEARSFSCGVAVLRYTR